MQSGYRFLPRPNLARYNVRVLELLAVYEWNEERQQILEPPLQPLDDVRLLLGGNYSYRPRGAEQPNHQVVVVMFTSNHEPENFGVSIRYTTNEMERPLDASLPTRQRDLAGKLFALGEAQTVDCSIQFQFTEAVANNLVFPLPAEVPVPGRLAEIFEIRGLRAAGFLSHGAQDPDYMFTLDRPSGNDIFLDIAFRVVGVIDPEFLDQVLKRGREIAAGITNQ